MYRTVAIAIVGATASIAVSAQEAEPARRNLKELLSPIQKRGVVTAVATEIGLIVISLGKEDGVGEGKELAIYRKNDFVARITVDHADLKWSAGKVVLKKMDPRLTDEVWLGRPSFTDEERKALLDFAFAFRPLKDEDRVRVMGVLAELESDEIAVRERATKELGEMAGPASAVLRSLDPASLGAEARARVEDALKELDRYNRMLKSSGLERDIEFLAVVDDPRGYGRLKRILSGVRPFSVAGFPEKDAGLVEYVTGWWAYSKDRVRWNPVEDRFEDK